MKRSSSASAFLQLLHLNLGRMLHGLGPDDEIDSSIGVTLSVLTLPGGFLSLLFFDKYGSLLRVLRGHVHFDPYAESLPDEYLFIVLSMLICGAVALWKWDSLFLDRRDFFNIVPLPVRTSQILFANLAAVFLFTLIFCFDVNAASSILYPIVVSASQESFLFFAGIAAGHIFAIVFAGVFAFTAVFAIEGFFLAIFPPKLFGKCVLFLRAVLAAVLLFLGSTALRVSSAIARTPDWNHSRLQWLPSVWFLGVCQWTRGAADPSFRHLAVRSFAMIAAVVLFGAFTYSFAYARHFARTIETTVFAMHRTSRLVSLLARPLDTFILRTPYEQAVFRFVLRTLFRSDRHRLAFVTFSLGSLLIASQLITFASPHRLPGIADYAAPLLLLYCMITGARFAFDLPSDLSANWIFRILLPPSLDHCSSAAAKFIALLTLPVLLGIAAIFFLRFDLRAASTMFVIDFALCLTLIASVVLTYRNIPFTRAKAGFQNTALLNVLLYFLGLIGFSFAPAYFQVWSRSSELWLLSFAPILGVAWWGIVRFRSEQILLDRQLTFDPPNSEALDLLNLRS